LTAEEAFCDQSWTAKDAVVTHRFTGHLLFHQLALILSAICMCLSVSISCWLIIDHAVHYLKPHEQKQYAFLIFRSMPQLTC
jgi:hypothetical protein